MFWILVVCIGCTYFDWKEDVHSIIIASSFLNIVLIIINIWCYKNLVNSIPAEKEIELLEKKNSRIKNFVKQNIDTNIEMDLNLHEMDNDLIIKLLEILITNRQKIIELNRSILYRKVYRKYLLFF